MSEINQLWIMIWKSLGFSTNIYILAQDLN